MRIAADRPGPRGGSGLPPGLAVKLERSRLRLQVKLWLQGLAWSAVVAAAVAALFGAAAHLAAAVALPVPSPAVAAWAVLGALTAGLIATTVRVVWAGATLQDAARLADLHYRLRERLSTSLEVASVEAGNFGLRPALHALLLRDAERCAAVVEPRELVRLRVSRPLWYLLPLAALAAPLLAVPPSRIAAFQTGPAALGAEEAGALAAKVHRAAELVAQDAAQRSDPYLQALSRALDTLGAELEHGKADDMSRVEAEARLGDLLDQLARAYGMDAPNGQAQPSSTQLGEPSSRLPAASQASTPDDDAAAEAPPDSERAGPLPRDSSHEPPGIVPRLDEMVAQLEMQGQPGSRPARRSPGADPEAAQDAPEQGSAQQTASTGQRQSSSNEQNPQYQALAAGQPMGPALNADSSPRMRAGEGSRPLDEGAETGVSLDPAKMGPDDVFLPNAEPREEGRIRMELVPPALHTEVADRQAPAPGAWEAHPQAPLARELFDFLDRDVVQSYFMPSEAAPKP